MSDDTKELIAPVRPVAKNSYAMSVMQAQDRLGQLLPPGVDVVQFVASAVQHTNSLTEGANPLTQKELSDPRTLRSFTKTILNCAVLGLLPGEALGHAYFVPYTFYRGKPSEHVVINLIPGYRGMLELAWASNFLLSCNPEIVLNDEASSCRLWHDTSGPQITHEIPLSRGSKAIEDIAGAYCTYTPKGGRTTMGEFVEADELRLLYRNASRRSPWKSGHLVPMCKKTAVRRTAKRWRMTRQLAQAIELDEQADNGELQTAFVEEPATADRDIDLDDLQGESSEDQRNDSGNADQTEQAK